MAVVTRQVPDI